MTARKSIVSSATAIINAKLDAANGKRRQRIVSYIEAVQAIREALRDGYGHVNGGTVARSYGYFARQTKVTAIAGEQAVIVSVSVGSAIEGSGTGLPWNRNASEDKIAKTIAEVVWTPAPKGQIRFSRKTAKAIVAAQDHTDSIRAAERIPAEYRNSEQLVTAADSLACGNCANETARVQS